ncbi:12343_t:CDS:2 [Ambispora gerdemannii]|uniref:12343_t:CDS:1 n=1 Tax=Ambispora gerdemannii TaxID=144530 RepID=A0A9N9D9M9_9GLOM|nr:12343_t:CDS:2 [Ambispora gerdemannii]
MVNVTTHSCTRQSTLSFSNNINNTLVFDDNQETIFNTEFNDSDSDNNAENLNINPNLNDIYETTENNKIDDNTSIISLPFSISINSTNQSITSTNQTPDTTICQVPECERTFTYHKTTSTIKIHLLSVHYITKTVIEKQQSSTSSITQTLLPKIISDTIKVSYSAKQQKEINQYLVKFIVETVQSLQLVEAPDFLNFCKKLDPKYKVPVTKTLKDEIDFAYYYTYDQVKEEINNSAEYVALTLDFWSSKAHLPYLEVTCHWLSLNFKYKEILLTIGELSYPHEASQIVEYIKNLLNIWNLEFKVLSITTDNAANVKKAIRDLRVGTHVSCAAHTLQLKDTNIQQDETPILDVIKTNNTRWNSTFYAFKRLLVLKQAIIILKNTLFEDNKINIRKEDAILQSLIPTSLEWHTIEKLMSLLEPFEQATRLMSDFKFATLGIMYPVMIGLLDRLTNDFSNLNDRMANNVKDVIQDDMKSRWELPHELEIYGSFFDLQFKDLSFISERAAYIQQIQIEYEVLHSVSDTNSTISQITSQEESSAIGVLFAKKNAVICPSVKGEFEKYLKIPELPALEKNDPIIW